MTVLIEHVNKWILFLYVWHIFSFSYLFFSLSGPPWWKRREGNWFNITYPMKWNVNYKNPYTDRLWQSNTEINFNTQIEPVKLWTNQGCRWSLLKKGGKLFCHYIRCFNEKHRSMEAFPLVIHWRVKNLSALPFFSPKEQYTVHYNIYF